ncbi:MAG: crotonase/enoyl-CoA hydratase family protein [Polyangiaceae bacterium]|nr:crotonase/enoyl-CoA hydratase family protein [Polyangiaceae bacterium]
MTTHYELQDGVAVIRLDDGKANALGQARVAAIQAHLDRAEQEANAVLIMGREGMFSAGFDLKEMMAGIESTRALVKAGGELMLRIFMSPLPVVAACTGHAMAGGVILLTACDLRIGAEGSFKIGLNEVSLGMTPPMYLVGLARHRLSPKWYPRIVSQSEIVSPADAVEAGCLDFTAPPEALQEQALGAARRLGALPRKAFVEAKRRERGALAQALREGLDEDLKTVVIAP